MINKKNYSIRAIALMTAVSSSMFLTACDQLADAFSEEVVMVSAPEPTPDDIQQTAQQTLPPADQPLQTAATEPENGGQTSDEISASPSATPEVSPTPHPAQNLEVLYQAVVTASSLNMREQPNTESKVVFGLFKNMRVNVLAEEEDWSVVRSGDIIGYVKTEFIEEAGDGLSVVEEEVTFFDDIKKEFVTKKKKFYWIIYGGNPRRFDAKLPEDCFEYTDKGTLVVSKSVRAICENLAKELYKSDTFSINCYFGQYYPSASKEDGSVYETGIHEGIDFGGPDLNAAFYSLTDGEVIAVQDSDNNQEYAWIAVRTGNYTVFYVHHSSADVKVGDKIKRGDKLGNQGDIGAPGAFHVHLALRRGRTTEFSRSKDTDLQDESPYEFWKSQGY